jgi:CDP-diacylglycerol---glycerol-3-phosphate 3-phosphatidyltransferase
MAFMTTCLSYPNPAAARTPTPPGGRLRYNAYRIPAGVLRLNLNLPNALTLTRIFLVPLLVVVLLTKVEWPVMGISSQVLGAAIFGVASLTDWLDGYVARRRKQVTTLGQLMDPIADKLLIAAALISLVQMDAAPAWMVAVVIGREFAVTALRSLAYSRGMVIVSSSLGKAKMASQVTAILLLILGHNGYRPFFVLGQIAMWVVVATSVVSAIDYYRSYARAAAG